MGTGPKKYSLTIQGHSTSLTLEPIFWQALNEAGGRAGEKQGAPAASDGKSLAALVAEIDEARTTNLSSAVRVWLFERAIGRP
jgi:predicted DNA-binding ribbon-helix-helix protein